MRPSIPSAAVAKAGATLWFLCFQYFVAEQIARLACTTRYSMARNVISDLGAVHCGIPHAGAAAQSVCSPLHWLMNSSFVLQGLLIFFGAVLVRRLFPAHRAFALARALLALAGIGVLVVGLVPEDVNMRAHTLGAAANFIGGGLGMLVAGIALLRSPGASKTAGRIAIAAGIMALAATLLLGLRDTSLWNALGWSIGTVERLAAYPLPLWLTGTGFWLLVRRSTRPRLS